MTKSAERRGYTGDTYKKEREDVKQKALVSGQAVSASGGRLRQEPSEARWLTLLWCGLGLLLPRATVWGGFAPFGVGLAASATGRSMPVVGLCVIFGYLWGGFSADGWLYAVAITVACGLHWVARAIPLLRDKRWLAPLLAGGSTLLAGLLLQNGFPVDLTDVALLLTNALLAAGFAAACTVAQQAIGAAEAPPAALPALELVTAVVLAAAGTVEAGDISPGRILTLLAVLWVTRTGRSADGVTFGTACGLAAVMVSPGSGSHGMTLAAVGMLGGIYARFGRVAGALLTGGLSLLFYAAAGEGEALMLGVYEAVVAGLLLLILPAGWEEKTRRWLCRREEHSAVAAWQLHWHNRLELAAHTLSEMAHTVEQVSEKLTGLSGPGLSDVYAGLGDTVCRHCPRRMVCWTNRYDETMDALNRLTPLLREEGRVTEDALLPGFAACPRRDRLAERLSGDFAVYRARETAFARLAELRRGVTGQFEEVSDLLADWARRAAEPVTVEIEPARRIREVCAGLGLNEAEITCRRLKNQGLAVQLWLPDSPTLPLEELRREIGEVCGQAFASPVVCRTGARLRISLCPPPRFRVRIGTAQRGCDGQTLCGDAVEQLANECGQVTAILSDGMGSGGRAAVDGTMCATLTARLLAAGFGADSTLQLVNTALMVRAGEESLATLDILTVDVYTGEMVCRKAGAAASLLKSGDRVSRIEQTSLPVGILREVRFTEYHDRLVEGDTVLMCSDGVYLGGCGWVEELLQAAPATQPPRELARAVVEEARRRAPAGREDDTTAVVVRLERGDAPTPR